MAAPRGSIMLRRKSSALQIVRNRLLVLAQLRRSFAKIVDCLDDVLRHFRFFAQLQRLLKICESVLVLSFFQIHAADIVQADCLQALVAGLALNLE